METDSSREERGFHGPIVEISQSVSTAHSPPSVLNEQSYWNEFRAPVSPWTGHSVHACESKMPSRCVVPHCALHFRLSVAKREISRFSSSTAWNKLHSALEIR